MSDIDGLADYAVSQSKNGKSISFEGVSQLNNDYIAKQAHGYAGVNAAIKEYNNLKKDSIDKANKFAETIGKSNANLGKYLSGLKNTTGGMSGYAISLVGATAKTIALEAATMALNEAVSMGVSFLIQGLISGISWLANYNERVQETRKEMIQLGQEAADTNKQLYDLIEQYRKLGEDGSIDLSDQETAKGIQEQIVELVGDQAKNIDLVNGKYDEEIEKLQQIKALGVGDSYNDISRAAKSAEANLRDGYTSKGVGGSDNTIMGGAVQTATESAKIKEVMTKNGFEDFGKEYYDGTYKFQLDTSDPEKMVESYYKAVELASVIARDYGEDIENSEGALYDFYNQLNKFIDNNKEDVEAYSAAIKNLHTMDANSELADYLKTNDIDSQEAFDSYIEGIKNSTEYSDAYKQVLIDVANDAFPQFSNSAKDAGENANEMTDSWQSLSDALKSVQSAYELFNEVQKEINSGGQLSTETIQKIIEKYPELEDEMYEYIIGMRTGASVMDLLKTKADDMSTMSAKAFKKMYLSSNSTSQDIKDDFESAFKIIGLEWDNTQSVMANVNTQIIDANGQATSTFVDQWAEACKLAGANVSTFAQGISSLLTGDFYDGTSGVYRVKGKGIYYKDGSGMDGQGTNLVNVKAMELIESGQFANSEKGRSDAYKAAYNILSNQMDKSWENQAEFEKRQKEFEERMKQLGATGDDSSKSGSDNTPSYEDPTDAIINRINLRADELKQQEEEIQNQIEIAELEKDYEKQISLTNDKIDIQRQRVEALNKANAGLHNEAEYLRNSNLFYDKNGNVVDTNTWFDSLGQKTEAYKNFYNSQSSKDEQERIKNFFENVSKYKEAYKDNAEEIVNINKEILQDEEDNWDTRRQIFDDRLEKSEDYIEHSKNFGWEYGDNEIRARQRVLEWIQTDYYKSLIKDDKEYYKILEENRLKYNEALEEEFNNATDFGSSYYDSKKNLLQSYYDVTNSIAEAQHEINKELETSKTMYEWLDEDTRKLLFNQKDYNVLYKELTGIQNKADKLRRQYERDLNNSTLDTIESITSQYEMQYETLMKSYEIAKADLEIAKKKQQLNNVLNERNVRMFINGQWQWVANTQDVINAQNELAEATYSKETAKAEKEQTDSLNNLTKQQDELKMIVNKFQSRVIDLDTATYNVIGVFDQLPTAIRIAIQKLVGEAYKSYFTTTSPSVVEGAIALDNGYADGTRYTSGGLTLLGEEESEMFIDSNGHLIPINQTTVGNLGSGGIVFNQDQMDFTRKIWDWSNIGALSDNNFINKSTPQTIEKTIDNRIIINGMTVDNGSSDGQALINALKRYVGNH